MFSRAAVGRRSAHQPTESFQSDRHPLRRLGLGRRVTLNLTSRSIVLRNPWEPQLRAIHNSSTSRTGSPASYGLANCTIKSRGQSQQQHQRRASPTFPLGARKIYHPSTNSNFTPWTTKRSFSSTTPVMTATKIDGTAIAKQIRERLHAEIEATQKINPRYRPSLKIIQGQCRSYSWEDIY